MTGIRTPRLERSPRIPADAVEQFKNSVLVWFDAEGRKDLPWQRAPTPFRVWISEIMLQQTQVAKVVPYFQRFTARIPDIAALATTPEETVLGLWSGLGYYARARNLHRCAVTVAERHGGELPRTPEELLALPGIGRSTAGAILSLGCGIPAAILDGNVKRVLSRFWGLEGWPGDAMVARQLWSIAEQLTPTVRCGAYNQAMMDLGALVCTRARPACDCCPLAADCRALATNRVAALPGPRPRRTLPVRQYAMLIVHDATGRVFMERRPPTGIWGGLWCFPMFQDPGQIDDWLAANGIRASNVEHLPTQRHTLSHFHLDYVPVRMRAEQLTDRVADANSSRWTSPDAGADLGLPAPVRRLLDQFNPHDYGASST